ncbi:uncharacterized protein LOC118746373 [Rhagoletis pomonella]|uniref:uncharacterized protein LOC118746373 n=1 Tax=Rhagoletis pomonella TaxID=28610 RepID=UPI0017849DC2|nr:uncharacterized protein LOC118746373 [Rhagoletis pomonella]
MDSKQMSMPRIRTQRRLALCKPRKLRVMTWTTECFNNKIKMALLILIWTLIWRPGECVRVSGGVGNGGESNQAERDNVSYIVSNLYEQMEISSLDVGDNEVVKALFSTAQQDAAKVEGGDLDDKRRQWRRALDSDQFSAINEMLNSSATASEKDWSKLFKRDLGEAQGLEAKVKSAIVDTMDGANFALPQQTDGMQATTATTTAAAAATEHANNTMTAATMNGDVKINDYQKVRNNGNENAKRPKVVDSGCAATQLPAATTTTTLAAASASLSGEQQKFVGKMEQGSAAVAEFASSLDVDVDVTAALQQQLIYEFAIKYKHIPRVTFFTCRWLSGQQRRMPSGDDDDRDQAGNQFDQQMTYLNMQTVEILERMYGTKVATAAKMRSDAGAAGAEAEPKLTANKVATTTKRVATAGAQKLTTTSKIAAATSTAGQMRANGNMAGQRTAVTSTTTTNAHKQSGKGSAASRREVPVPATAGADDANTHGTTPSTATPPRDILIKVVHIDQLINNRPTATNNKNTKNSRYNWYAQRTFGAGFGSGYGRSAGARNVYANANWLEQALHGGVGSRQVVVLNLACGAASRRLLEMASKKALFNSTYHWLLIEDYTFNRQAGFDGNVDKSEHQYNEQVINSKNSENNKSNEDSTSNSDSDNDILTGKFFPQQKQSQQLQQQKASVPATSAATVAHTAIVATSTSANKADGMEIIEKYLEKINININTELILAKRHTRRIRDGCRAQCSNIEGKAAKNGSGGVRSGRDGRCTADSESATNNTLQRKDYYQLYDVWSPGQQYGGQLNISEIGYFALDDGLQIALWYRRSTTITRRMDMKMARIRCLIVVTNKNFTDTLEHYLTTRYDTHLDSMNRFNFALLSHVRDLYNFSFVLSKTASWGYLKNGKFDGMIGALVRKQADIGGSPIFFRIERAKVIDYTTRTWVARPCFIFRHPPSTKKDRIVFLQPFSNTVWISLGFCGIFTICLLWLLTTVERRLEALGVVEKLGQSVRDNNNSNSSKSNNTAKQQSAIGGNDELLGRYCSTRTTTTTTTTSGCGTMHCCSNDNAAAAAALLFGPTKAQRKQKMGKLGKLVQQQRKAEERKNVKRISCRPCMLGCGSACCGQTSTDVTQQRFSLFFESVLFYVSSICQQGLTFSTSFFSGRCIVITSLLFAFAIYQFYSASIVGTLLMEKPKTIRTLRDLIHSSLEVGIEDIAYNRDYFLRTKDPIAMELYAKKVTTVPTHSETHTATKVGNATALPLPDAAGLQPNVELTEAQKSKAYRDILHSHETGAHAKINEASNWYDPQYGVDKIRRGKFAFHVDVATAYKIIADTFNEKEICELTEIQLFPPQKMVSIVQKGSPLRKMITYGLRRVTETGLMDYQRKVWHSPKPRCVKQIHTDDLRVDLQTFASALLVLIFGYAVSLLALSIELIQHKLWQRYVDEEAARK